MSKRYSEKIGAEFGQSPYAMALARHEKFIATRSPDDRLTAEEKALLFGVRCPPEEDTARQEFKADADTSTILSRYGAGASFPMPSSGVVDYTAEFRQLADAAVEAKQAFERIPLKLRRGYANWREFLEGVSRGEVEYSPPAATAGGSGGAAGGAPSDSAAEEAPKGA